MLLIFNKHNDNSIVTIREQQMQISLIITAILLEYSLLIS